MSTVFKIPNFGPVEKRYELKPYRHYGRDGYVIEVSVGEKNWRESVFCQDKLQAIDHIFKMLFLTPTLRAQYKRDLHRYPHFDYQKLAAQTSEFEGIYSISLTGRSDGFDLVYDDFVDNDIKNIDIH